MASENSSFNDRALTHSDDGALPKPQIEIVVDGTHVFKPGMKTFFVDTAEPGEPMDVRVTGTSCSCDTVVSSYLVCTCESVSVCNCEVFSSGCTCQAFGSGGGGTICTCQAVSCGSPCACIPVYY